MSVQMRRFKTVTPDTEKDDRYWEKRKRNNLAAKKSRENKRQFENSIRDKVFALEKENILLKKELALIKSRFGIPDGQSLLTTEEQEKWLKAADEFQRLTTPAVGLLVSTMPSPHLHGLIKSEPTDNSVLSCSASLESSQDRFMPSLVDTSVLTQAHASRNSHTPSSGDIREFVDAEVLMYRNGLTNISRNVYSNRSCTDPGESCEVTDLSLKKRKLPDADTDGSQYERGYEEDRLYIDEEEHCRDANDNDTSTCASRKRIKAQSYEKVLNASNEDLKFKLEALSEQVQTMYKIVYSSE